ncbi:PREDICTED: mitochondrial genome maintenance exonuclease 1 [Nanorana parkeri]|uniref:mitochondrial genome maintenance exonuclease 1 n=1 Tax=Nanorana parkeri TaxID=125878 RepID=UPI0008544888|nr:PREDICTED: mitochondrial genome maintenance exonuclease 1 [Nanorana parkeri]
MKAFHLISRNCKGLANVLFQHQHISAFLSTSCTSHSKKNKVNGYEDVDQERYNSLVRMVRSSRTSSQTPERIFEEDNFLYGKVIKSQLPSEEPEPSVPQSNSSLYNSNKVILPTEKTDPSIPVKIGLPARDQMANGRLPSVTRILQQTMPMEQAFHLERWKQRMIMELGEEGFIAYTAAVFSQGKLFHARLEDVLQCRDDDIHRPDDTEAMSGYLASVEHVLSDVAELRTLESAVLHSELKYLGIVDCVAHYRGKLCIIDWKTSEKQKAHIQRTFDNPLQIAAYVGALNHDANYNFQVDCGLIVVAYKDGSPAHAHLMDPALCKYYWDKWLLRLEEYKEKKEETK